MQKQVLVLLAEGCEEIEAVTVIDLLVRAGIAVTQASSTEQCEIICSRGVKIVAQQTWSQVAAQQFDAIVLPGGMQGAEHFRDNPAVIEKIQQLHQQGSLVAGICATPALVFAYHQLFPKAKMTGYPTMQAEIAHYQTARVHYDAEHQLLTSQGPGTAIDFALKLIALLTDNAAAQQVAQQLVLPSGIADYHN